MFIGRKYNFQANTLIFGNQLEEELDQIYNHLNGTLGLPSLIKGSDNAEIIITVEQTTDAQLAVAFRKLEIDRVTINKELQLTLTPESGIAPLAVLSTTVVANLNAPKLDGVSASGFLLTGKRIYMHPVMLLEGVVSTSSKCATFITPAGSNMKLITGRVTASSRGSALTGQTQGSLRLNGLGIWSWILDYDAAVYPDDTEVFNQALVEDDRLDLIITSVGGDAAENVTMYLTVEESMLN